MATPFFRTTRAVEADGSPRRLWSLAVVALLGAGWLAWFFGVPVGVYETSQSARLEVDRAIHPVEAAVAGRVVATRLKLSETVQAGEILVELEAEKEKRRLDEEQRRLAGLAPQREALHRQIAAEEDALRLSRQTSRTASNEARARKQEAEVASKFADDESARLSKIGNKLAALDVLRAQAEAEQRRSAAAALGLDVARVESDQLTRESQARAHIEQLHRDLADVESQVATTSAAVDVLAADIERHLVRAPVAGRVGAVLPTLQPGAFVKEGERLGAIVPSGELRVAAELTPASAIGRVREGQEARLRLDGFPWTQFGSVRARVVNVEAEPRDGHVRVELTVVGAPPAVPMQHGLPGRLEVEVERATPAVLVLRAAGRLVTPPSGQR
jgi:membrane fusion protein (multidrug efflux system)